MQIPNHCPANPGFLKNQGKWCRYGDFRSVTDASRWFITLGNHPLHLMRSQLIKHSSQGSALFRKRHLTFSPAHSSLSLILTHTFQHVQNALPKVREAGKSTTPRLMKNKSPLKSIYKKFQPNIHHSFLTANPLFGISPADCFQPYMCMFFPLIFTFKSCCNARIWAYRVVTSVTTDFWTFKSQSRPKAAKQGFLKVIKMNY